MSRNLDTLKVNNKAFMKKRLKSMKEAYDPIVINLPGNNFQRIYYDRSTTLNKLTYYPYVQLGVILLFILVAYLAFDASRKAEQNQVWIGLTKETAHQLGTPISSLLAWFEMLKTQDVDPQIINELSKDINRLEVITERFSKVGSKPKLALFNIYDVLYESIHYIRTRTSKKLDITCQEPEDPMYVPLNKSLFAWVIENVCKNSIDAMNGAGKIDIRVQDNMQVIYIDIHDNGKGIPKTKFKSIFKPGYTTKNRGWGLGLSLSKRIVEEYHNGKIFVQSSETGEGTIMRIVLKKFHSHK
jgi:signal transduction histidine kinase